MRSWARSAAVSRATESSNRPIISRGAIPTDSNRGSARLASRLNLGIGLFLLRSRGDQLVDLTSVHVDDLERPAVVLERLAGLREMLEHRQREPGDGRIITV